MTAPVRTRYAGYRFPAEIIGHAVWLYFRFPLGLRMVEELLAARGIIVSHETVRQWARKFGQQFANQIRRRLPRAGDKWHPDGVSRTHFWGMWSCTRDEGGPLDVGGQAQASNHWTPVVKSDGGERCSKRRDKSPSGVIRRGERKRTADEVSKCHRRCQNRGAVQLPGSVRELS